MYSLLAGWRRRLGDLAENGFDIAAKLGWVFAHREVSHFFHDTDTGAGNRGCSAFGVFRRAGEIILAGEQIERAYFSIDLCDTAAQIADHPVEIKVALEHARPALLVGPQRLPARSLRALRRDQPRDQRGADFAAMHVGPVEPGGVIPRRLEVGG